MLHPFGIPCASHPLRGLSTGHPCPAKDARRPCRAPSGYSAKDSGARCNMKGLKVKTKKTVQPKIRRLRGLGFDLPLPSMQPSIAAFIGLSSPLSERSEFGWAPMKVGSAGYPRSGQIVGCTFFWLLFFGQSKKSNSQPFTKKRKNLSTQ